MKKKLPCEDCENFEKFGDGCYHIRFIKNKKCIHFKDKSEFDRLELIAMGEMNGG